MLIRVRYFDQNETFAKSIPKHGLIGRVARQLSLRDWGDDWLVLTLTSPFDYEGHSYQQIVVKSRWKDHHLGGASETSVFILLCSDPNVLCKSVPESADFNFVAWGMAESMAVP
jgi:hypothetical protein